MSETKQYSACPFQRRPDLIGSLDALTVTTKDISEFIVSGAGQTLHRTESHDHDDSPQGYCTATIDF
jgi:hypothetical protein